MTRTRGPRRRLLPRWGAGLAAVALALLGLAAGAAPASAHSNLLFAAPAAGSAVAAAPGELVLLFDSPMQAGGTRVEVRGPAGPLALGAATVSSDRMSVHVPADQKAGPGVYTVAWQATGADGDTMSGTYQYAVGPTVSSLGGSQQGSGLDWPAAALRALAFAALAVAAGEAAGTAMMRRARAGLPVPRPLGRWAAAAGAGATAGLAVLAFVSGGAWPDTPAAIAQDGPGLLALGEAVAFALASLLWPRRGSLVPLAAVILTEAARAHPQLAAGLPGAALTLVHLGSAAVWSGALLHTLRTAHAARAEPGKSRLAIRAYARPAVWLLAAAALSGAAAGVLLVPAEDALSTGYGLSLLAKAGLVAAAALLALAARTALRRGKPASRIVRPARLEAASLAGVLALSAILTALPAPTSADAPLAMAPPPTGPVVPAGALAGNIGVSAAASSGQLVVRLSVPDTGADPSFRLTGSLQGPDGGTTQLRFRPCGTGCFAAPAAWAEGSSRATLRPESPGWDSEPVALSFAFPAVPAEDLLARAVAATRAAPRIALHESTTSDTVQGPGTPQAFALTGADFTARALYAQGRATTVLRLPDEAGRTRLLLAYPSEGVTLEMTLDSEGRIAAETQTAPHHLVTRALVYPPDDGD